MDVEQRVKIAICLSIAARSMRFAELPEERRMKVFAWCEFRGLRLCDRNWKDCRGILNPRAKVRE